jgi:hypothetical protein
MGESFCVSLVCKKLALMAQCSGTTLEDATRKETGSKIVTK